MDTHKDSRTYSEHAAGSVFTTFGVWVDDKIYITQNLMATQTCKVKFELYAAVVVALALIALLVIHYIASPHS